MLIIINGTIGIGKTWIARWLVSQIKDAAYIEGDTLGFVSPELLLDQSRHQFSLQVGLDLIIAFRIKLRGRPQFGNELSESVKAEQALRFD